MDLVSFVHEGLVKFTVRAGFHALASFLQNNVAFRVEFAKYRIEQTVRFNACPQFYFIGRQTDEVGCYILAGCGVHVLPAVFRVKPVNFIRDIIFSVLILQFFKLRGKRHDTLLIGLVAF